MILNMKIYHSTATYGLYSQDTALFKGLAMLSPTYVTAAITTAFLYDHTCLLCNLARIWNQTQSLCVIKIFTWLLQILPYFWQRWPLCGLQALLKKSKTPENGPTFGKHCTCHPSLADKKEFTVHMSPQHFFMCLCLGWHLLCQIYTKVGQCT